MASSGKQKTTTAKRIREARVRERRLEKQAKKEARKLAAAMEQEPAAGDAVVDPAPESVVPVSTEPDTPH
jgi:hypothetical protein